MQLEMYYNFFLGFWSSAPLVFLCGVYLAVKRALGVVADDV